MHRRRFLLPVAAFAALTYLVSCGDDVTNITEQAGIPASSLAFHLTWVGNAGVRPDLDIAVHDPAGNNLSWSDPGSVVSTPQGGTLDVDDAGSCGGATNGERVQWNAAPPPGTYAFGITYVDECDFDHVDNQPPANYTVQIHVDGQLYKTLSGTISSSEQKNLGSVIIAML